MKTLTKKTTDKIIETVISKLEEVNANEWEKYTNFSITFPKNAFSKKAYRGINVFMLLLCDILPKQRASSDFATFNQISKRNGILKKGSKATPIEFISFYYLHTVTREKITVREFEKLSEALKSQYYKYASRKVYNVFNILDVENIQELNYDLEIDDTEESEFEEILEGEEIIKNLISNKNLNLEFVHSDTAFYSPLKDLVCLPEKKYFISEPKYYSTAFHELIHWTGHESRLKRELSQIRIKYSYEELIAELGSVLACFEIGVTEEFINSVRYLKGWLTVQEESKREEVLRNAFSQSKKAVRFLFS